jgi:DNA ligase-1
MLAHNFDAAKHGIAGWFASEKLDGNRAVWIPGTRGMLKEIIPFANVAKDERYKEEQISSGLWSRYGNVIHAPDWWLDKLPMIPLDGELFTRRGTGGRQELSSIIKKLKPDDVAWQKVKFMCFDMPSIDVILGNRSIKVPNFEKHLHKCIEWYISLDVKLTYAPKPGTRFESTYFLLQKHLTGDVAIAHKQFQLAFQTGTAVSQLEAMIHEVSENDGEGIILREPASCWETERSWKLLKAKKLNDDEGIVKGYITGRETDKGSKLLGMMGALVLDYGGKRLELSGFNDEERKLDYIRGYCKAEAPLLPFEWASQNPGAEVPSWINNPLFPRGTRVTFKFRGVTADGIPQEARFWRRKVDE